MEADVWAWPEGATTPVKAGTFARDDESGRGQFTYDSTYVKSGGLALDPDQLRQLGARHAIVFEPKSREGLPGRFADSGPDSWGRTALQQTLGYAPNALEALMYSADDGVGNLVLGDLSKKPPIPALSLDQLAEGLEMRQAGQTLPHGPLAPLLSPDTALGGAQPKATMGIAGFPWIAKFPGRGGLVNLPYYEALAMRLAAMAGINVAEVTVEKLPGDRSIFLARRFDREQVAGGVRRFGFASALTVLGSAGELPGPERSYIALARRMKRWVGAPGHAAALREMWLRISFNGLVGNADDHPRNHGFLFNDGVWRFAPAFDIVPVRFEQDKIALAMGFYTNPEGRSGTDVHGQSLLAATREFGVPAEEGKELLLSMGNVIAEKWQAVLSDLKAPQSVYAEMQGMVNWAARITAQVAELDPAAFPPINTRSRRRWPKNSR